jgi:hypothetical protein
MKPQPPRRETQYKTISQKCRPLVNRFAALHKNVDRFQTETKCSHRNLGSRVPTQKAHAEI